MRKVITESPSRTYTLKYTGKRKMTTNETSTFGFTDLKNCKPSVSGYTTTVRRKCVKITVWKIDDKRGRYKKGDKITTEMSNGWGKNKGTYTEYSSKRIRPTKAKALAHAERRMKNNPA